MRAFIDGWLRRRQASERRRAAAMRIRGIRGAIDVESDSRDAIGRAVAMLIRAVQERNGLEPDEIISAIFTTTPDLVSMFPALAARDAGWGDVPLLCASEIAVPGSLPRCIRVLVHVERFRDHPVEHVYLGAAAALRPDLLQGGGVGVGLPKTGGRRQHIMMAASAAGGETPRR